MMNKKVLFTILAVGLFASTGRANVDLDTLESLTGFDFYDVRAFADTAVGVEVTNAGLVYDFDNPAAWWTLDDFYFEVGVRPPLSIYDALTDMSMTTVAAYTGNETDPFHAYVELGFVDNVLANGPGDDIVIFTVSTIQDYDVRLDSLGPTLAVTPQTIGAGLTSRDFGGMSFWEVRAATVDLADLGLAGWQTTDKIQIDMLPVGAGAVPALVGYLHATPVPGAVLLGGIGVIIIAGLGRRRIL